jgi:hypothetical protein
MIQHNAHGADADLTSNSRGPFKVFRRFLPPPPYLELSFFNARNVVVLVVVGNQVGDIEKERRTGHRAGQTKPGKYADR